MSRWGEIRDLLVAVDFVVTTPAEYAKHVHDIGLVYREIARTGKELYAA